MDFAARKEIGLISDFEREEMRPGCCEDRFRFPDSSLLSSFSEIESQMRFQPVVLRKFPRSWSTVSLTTEPGPVSGEDTAWAVGAYDE